MKNIRPKKGYGFIYKYTSPSGKSYIGQTKRTLSERAGGARGKGYKDCPIFYQAIKKYGFSNFEVSILAEVKIEQLDKMEQKYIYLFNTAKPNGYNCETFLPIIQHAVWSQVKMIDMKGNVIAVFPSISRAADYVKGERNPIKKVCRGELQSAYGYKWECAEIIMEKKYNNTAKKIYKLDKTSNEVLEVFPSISAAAKSLGKSTSLIRRVLDQETRTAYGFKWKTAQGSTTIDS